MISAGVGAVVRVAFPDDLDPLRGSVDLLSPGRGASGVMVDFCDGAEVLDQRADGARIAFVVGGRTVGAAVVTREVALHVFLEQLEFGIDGAVHPADEGAAGGEGVGQWGW